ncbi:glycine receptor subunit alpha-2 [Trichonephila clavipes]|nr:glycine receptor subunit alpha-2 [Trichonephila clavipes]
MGSMMSILAGKANSCKAEVAFSADRLIELRREIAIFVPKKYFMSIDTPVSVNVSIRDANIRSIDESDMSFSVTIELWQSWDDYRLLYPSWLKKNYQVLDSHWLEKLWTPNIYFVNAVEGKTNNIITPSSFFWLGRNKRIFYCCRHQPIESLCKILVMVTSSWLKRHEFEPRATKDPPCRRVGER